MTRIPCGRSRKAHAALSSSSFFSIVPPVLLRSALRTLVSQGAATQRPFVQHVRSHLLESPPPLTDARELFPPTRGVVSAACLEYIAFTRCVLSSKLAKEALS